MFRIKQLKFKLEQHVLDFFKLEVLQSLKFVGIFGFSTFSTWSSNDFLAKGTVDY
jgi:hypothetical protein